jgi:hypothetical protein
METPRRGRANRVIDLRERDPEPRPARWPADGWSLGSVAPSGPRIAWATSGATTAMRTRAPVESTEANYPEVARPGWPDVARSPRPAAARTSPRTTSQLPASPQFPQWNSPRTQARTASPRPQMAAAPRTAPVRQAAPGRQGGPVRQPAAGHLPAQRPASRPVQRPVAREQARRANLDERPYRAAVGQTRRAPDPKSSARWRVVDLTPEPRQRPLPAPPPTRIASGRSEIKERQETEARRWALAAGAESQGAPGPLPAVFRLDPLHARNEAGSRAR